MSGGNNKASKQEAPGGRKAPGPGKSEEKIRPRAAKRGGGGGGGDAAVRPEPPGGGACPTVETLPVG